MCRQIKLLILSFLLAGVLMGCGVVTSKTKEASEQPHQETTVFNNDGDALENEEVLFSFITTNQKKLIVSYAAEEDALKYRFFNKNHLEIALPEKGINSWDFFTFEDFHQVGSASTQVTDVNQLIFVNEHYRYEVYDNYEKAGKKRQVGVRVIALKDNQSYEIQGDAESTVGTLMLLYERFPKLTHRVMGE